MKLCVIGLPGSGRATLFESLTRLSQDTATGKIEDRIGTIEVPDKRIAVLSGMYKPKKTIYTKIEYLLPYMAAHGKEKKEAEQPAWSTVRTCDALIHVVRNFKGYGLEDPAPLKDFDRLNEEMIFNDLLVVEKRLERLERDAKRGTKVDPEESQLLLECKKMLEDNRPLRRNPELSRAHVLRGFTFLSAKPMLVIFNNEDGDESLPEAVGLLDQEECQVVRARLEHELSRMDADEAKEFLAEFGIATSAMDRVIALSYKLLGLISFFTVGEDEVRAWTIRNGTVSVDAAEVIHSDIKKGFIRAEVVSYNDLIEAGSHKEAKKKGTVRLEGKTYVVQDGDIMEFRFNV